MFAGFDYESDDTRAYAESDEEGNVISILEEQQVHHNGRELLEEPKLGTHYDYLERTSQQYPSKKIIESYKQAKSWQIYMISFFGNILMVKSL